MEKTPPKSMAINVEVGYKIIPLYFGTFFGAYFKCNKFGHFAKQCPTTKESKEGKQVKVDSEVRPVMEPKETGKRPVELAMDVKDKQEAQSEYKMEKPKEQKDTLKEGREKKLSNPRTLRAQHQR